MFSDNEIRTSLRCLALLSLTGLYWFIITIWVCSRVETRTWGFFLAPSPVMEVPSKHGWIEDILLWDRYRDEGCCSEPHTPAIHVSCTPGQHATIVFLSIVGIQIVAILDKRGLFNVAATIRKDNRVVGRGDIRDDEGVAVEDCRLFTAAKQFDPAADVPFSITCEFDGVASIPCKQCHGNKTLCEPVSVLLVLCFYFDSMTIR